MRYVNTSIVAARVSVLPLTEVQKYHVSNSETRSKHEIIITVLVLVCHCISAAKLLLDSGVWLLTTLQSSKLAVAGG